MILAKEVRATMATKTQKQDALLAAALAKGSSVEQAAVQAGVSERTAYRRVKKPELQKRVDALQEEMIQQNAAIMTTAAQDANRSLIVLQDPSSPPAVRRAAARDILEMGIRYHEAADIERRLTDLENQSVGAHSSLFQPGAMQAPPTGQRRRRGETPLILALATGASVPQAALKAGLSERTVFRRLANPAFHKRIEAVRTDTVKRVSAMLIAASRLAAKTLLDLQDPKTPPAIRRRAARDILELGLKLRRSAVLEKRLGALEIWADRDDAKISSSKAA
jgi:hypothetical protein